MSKLTNSSYKLHNDKSRLKWNWMTKVRPSFRVKKKKKKDMQSGGHSNLKFVWMTGSEWGTQWKDFLAFFKIKGIALYSIKVNYINAKYNQWEQEKVAEVLCTI